MLFLKHFNMHKINTLNQLKVSFIMFLNFIKIIPLFSILKTLIIYCILILIHIFMNNLPISSLWSNTASQYIGLIQELLIVTILINITNMINIKIVRNILISILLIEPSD